MTILELLFFFKERVTDIRERASRTITYDRELTEILLNKCLKNLISLQGLIKTFDSCKKSCFQMLEFFLRVVSASCVCLSNKAVYKVLVIHINNITRL